MHELLENHVRCLYRLLDHKGSFTRLGSLDTVTKAYEDVYVKGEEEVINYARKWNGIRNVFIGRAARDSSNRPMRVSVVSFDLDPIREKGAASTDEQHNASLSAGRRILSVYPGGYLSSSGNGCLLIYRLSSVLGDMERHYEQEGVLIEELNQLVKDLDVRIDPTNYDQAVIKLLGTQSTKGEASLRRTSRFIELPIPPFRNSSRLVGKLSEIKVQEKPEAKRSEGDPVKRLQDAKQILSTLDKKRNEDYECWLKVGMSLKEFGNAGLTLWEQWSRLSTKYQEGICEEKWKTFEDTPAVTLGTLRYWAAEDERAAIGASSVLPPDGTTQLLTTTYFEELFSPKTDSNQSICTGFERLDEALGPFPPGELVTYAARSGFGKSTFACTVAENLRKAGRRVLYFSTEMHRKYIMDKFVALSCDIPLPSVLAKAFTQSEIARIQAWQKAFESFPITICDSFQPSIEMVRALVLQQKPDLVIYDHINQAGTHWEEVAKYTRALKDFAKENGTRFMLLAQLNEPPRDQKTGLEMSSVRGDIRGTQEIVHLSSAFVFLSNPFPVKGQYQPVHFNISKNRYGISGTQVELTCDKVNSKFLEGKNAPHLSDVQ